MLYHTLHTATDTVLFAIDVRTDPEPTKSSVVGGSVLELLNWALWGIFIASVVAVVLSAGKLAWEEWSSGSSDNWFAGKILVGSWLVGSVAGMGIITPLEAGDAADAIAGGIHDVAELGPIGIAAAILLGVFIACIAVVVLLRRRIGPGRSGPAAVTPDSP